MKNHPLSATVRLSKSTSLQTWIAHFFLIVILAEMGNFRFPDFFSLHIMEKAKRKKSCENFFYQVTNYVRCLSHSIHAHNAKREEKIEKKRTLHCVRKFDAYFLIWCLILSYFSFYCRKSSGASNLQSLCELSKLNE